MKQLLRLSLVLALVVVCSSLGHANQIFNYTSAEYGAFASDSDYELFTYTSATGGPVDAYTTSFADPTNGFEPVLSLFDASGTYWYNGYADCEAGVNCNDGIDTSATGLGDLGAADADLQWIANPGETYYIVLTEYGNFSQAPQFVSGQFSLSNPVATFTYPYPNDNFSGSDGTPFWYQGSAPPVPRNGDWALTISGPDDLQSQQLPEPSSQTYLLIGGGMCLLAGLRRRRQRSN